MPLRVLVVDDETDLRELLSLEIESEFAAEVRQASSGNEAAKLIADSSILIDAVICDYSMPDGNGSVVQKALLNSRPGVPFVLCSANSIENCPGVDAKTLFSQITKPDILAPLREIFERLKAASHLKSTEEIRWVSIPIGMMNQFNIVPVDTFVKLGETQNQLVMKKGEVMSVSLISRCTQKGASRVLVKAQDAVFISEALLRDWSLFWRAKQAPSQKQTLVWGQNAVSALKEMVDLIGVTPEVQSLVKKSTEFMAQNMALSPDTNSWFSQLIFNPDSYFTGHSIVVGQIAGVFANILGWGLPSTLMKFAAAGMLHDMTINSSTLNRLQILDGAGAGELPDNLTQIEKAYLRMHPLQAAEIVKQFSELPAEVDVIVREHHECPDGSGFPSSLHGDQIHPLSMVFIIAHRVVSDRFARGEKSTPLAVLEGFPESYLVGRFGDIVKDLKNHLCKS